MSVFGHKKCRSEVEVVDKETFDIHTHGNITRDGKLQNVQDARILITDEYGNIVGRRNLPGGVAFGGNVTVNGKLTAEKVVGAVYA